MKKISKRVLSSLLVLSLACGTLAACGGKDKLVLCQETVQVKLKDFLKLPSVLNYPILLDIVLHSRSVTGSHNNYVS